MAKCQTCQGLGSVPVRFSGFEPEWSQGHRSLTSGLLQEISMPCLDCDGSGIERRRCQACQGRGSRLAVITSRYLIGPPEGSEMRVERICSACQGSGEEVEAPSCSADEA
jgi:DnaJ-class molecular chaperone